MKCPSLAEGSRGIWGISHRCTARGTTTPPVITVALRWEIAAIANTEPVLFCGEWIGTAQGQFLPMEKQPVWARMTWNPQKSGRWRLRDKVLPKKTCCLLAVPSNYCYFIAINYHKLYGYGSIPIDTFLVGWTSIYQLFWGSLGTRVLTHPHIEVCFLN